MREKVVVRVPTRELWRKVVQKMIYSGYRGWGNDGKDTGEVLWCGKYTCLDAGGDGSQIQIGYCHEDWYKEQGHQIISAEEFLGEETIFKIGDRVKMVKRFPENSSGNGKELGIGRIESIDVANMSFSPERYWGKPEYRIYNNVGYVGRFIAEELELLKRFDGSTGDYFGYTGSSIAADSSGVIDWAPQYYPQSIVEELYKFKGTGEKISQPKKNMNKLNSMMKRLLDKPSQTLYKAGFINGDLELTEKGADALRVILFDANKVELVKQAEEELKEEKENK